MMTNPLVKRLGPEASLPCQPLLMNSERNKASEQFTQAKKGLGEFMSLKLQKRECRMRDTAVTDKLLSWLRLQPSLWHELWHELTLVFLSEHMENVGLLPLHSWLYMKMMKNLAFYFYISLQNSIATRVFLNQRCLSNERLLLLFLCIGMNWQYILAFSYKLCTMLVFCCDDFFLTNLHSHMHGALKLAPMKMELRTKLTVMTEIS